MNAPPLFHTASAPLLLVSFLVRFLNERQIYIVLYCAVLCWLGMGSLCAEGEATQVFDAEMPLAASTSSSSSSASSSSSSSSSAAPMETEATQVYQEAPPSDAEATQAFAPGLARLIDSRFFRVIGFCCLYAEEEEASPSLVPAAPVAAASAPAPSAAVSSPSFSPLSPAAKQADSSSTQAMSYTPPEGLLRAFFFSVFMSKHKIPNTKSHATQNI